MKKVVIMAMLAVAANFLSPLMPAVHAATADEVLTQLLAQNPNTAQVQEVLAIKQDLEQGNRGAIVGRVAQAALERAGQGQYAGMASVFANGGDVRTAVASTVRQELTARVAAQLSPYGDQLNLLAELLQNSGLIPKTVLDSNSLIGAAGNYPQIIQ
ncbi:MAG TPA: hypothetical protein VN521_06810 [Negativicutes bacterium]|nr:hypothetical protein [Negativicutes bacterium]